MIVEWLMQMSVGFHAWLASLFPPVDLPEWVDNPFGGLLWVVEAAAGWGVWVNVGALALIATTVLTVYAVGFGIKLVRVVVAHIPFVGGGG
jgi:hypothetical protein